MVGTRPALLSQPEGLGGTADPAGGSVWGSGNLELRLLPR